jgi:DNA-binding CsgD family transcriptional regulator
MRRAKKKIGRSHWELIDIRRAQVRELVYQGCGRQKIAEKLGVSVSTIYADLRSLKISLKAHFSYWPSDQENQAYCMRHSLKLTYVEIGRCIGLSREAARQCVLRCDEKKKQIMIDLGINK